MVAEKKSGIRIECKGCKKSQIYTMRSKTIPKRPKTQCTSCGKWIYIDREVLVKEFGQKDLVKEDQKKEISDIIGQERGTKEHKEHEIKPSKELTKKYDQRPKNMTKDQKVIRSVVNIHTPDRNKERLYDVYFKTDTIENLAKKYDIPKDYLNKIKSKFEKLKYSPRIEGNKLVCYQCGMESKKRLVFHHNHKTNEYIALVCDSCNQKLDNNESVIYPLRNSTNSRVLAASGNSHLYPTFDPNEMLLKVKEYAIKNTVAWGSIGKSFGDGSHNGTFQRRKIIDTVFIVSEIIRREGLL